MSVCVNGKIFLLRRVMGDIADAYIDRILMGKAQRAK